MTRTIFLVILVATLISLATIGSSARQTVEILLRGHYYSEPATVRITVAIEPAANQRALIIEADGDRYYRSSALTLDGEGEKRMHSVEFKSLPAGNYTLRAQVRSADDVLATATQDLVVTGVGGR